MQKKEEKKERKEGEEKPRENLADSDGGAMVHSLASRRVCQHVHILSGYLRGWNRCRGLRRCSMTGWDGVKVARREPRRFVIQIQ